MRWLTFCVLLIAGQVDAQCSGGCNSIAGYPAKWVNNQWEPDTPEAKCCAHHNTGTCYDDRHQECHESEDWYGKNHVCNEWEDSCESACCNKYTQRCVKISPRHDADWKWGVCADAIGASDGMRAVLVPLFGCIFTIAATVITLVFSAKKVFSQGLPSKVMLIFIAIVNFFCLFLWLGDLVLPFYGGALVVMNCVILASLCQEMVIFQGLILFKACLLLLAIWGNPVFGIGYGDETGLGMWTSAAGAGFSGCHDSSLDKWYKVIKPTATQFAEAAPTTPYNTAAMWDGNPAQDYWGLCKIEWFGVTSFFTLLVALFYTAELLLFAFIIGNNSNTGNPKVAPTAVATDGES